MSRFVFFFLRGRGNAAESTCTHRCFLFLSSFLVSSQNEKVGTPTANLENELPQVFGPVSVLSKLFHR